MVPVPGEGPLSPPVSGERPATAAAEAPPAWGSAQGKYKRVKDKDRWIDHCVELHIIYSFSYTGLPQHSPLAISRTQNGSKRLGCFSKENKYFNQKTEVTGSGPCT